MILVEIIVVCSFLFVVKYDAVVEEPHFNVGKAQVVVCLLGEFFPVANRIIGYVADGASCEPEFFAGGCFALDELLD